MIFSTVQYQSGALEYAKKHGIALARVIDGGMLYETKSYNQRLGMLSPGVPPYAAYIVSLSEEGHESYSLMREGNSNRLLEQFDLNEERHRY
jgi:hypothetical protein